MLDGLTLLGRLRAELPHIRCIMLTAHRDFDYVQGAMRQGAVGYSLKSPVDLELAKEALDRACEGLEKDARYTEKVRTHQQLIRNYNYSLRSPAPGVRRKRLRLPAPAVDPPLKVYGRWPLRIAWAGSSRSNV